MLKTLIMKAALVAFLGSISFAAFAVADTQRFDVPAGELAAALESFAKQANVDLVYQEKQVKGLRTNGVSGTFSAQEAVTKLLEGTPLQLRTDQASGAILITTPTSGGPAGTQGAKTFPDSSPRSGEEGTRLREGEGMQGEGKERGFWSRFRLAEADQGEPSSSSRTVEKDKQNPLKDSDERMGEVLVTGTRLGGAAVSSLPVRSFDREQVEASGQPTVGSFLSTLTETGRAMNEDTLLVGQSSVTLRGLPLGTTLVLLNGRRTNQSGFTAGPAAFFDLSTIPLAAIERIDVVSQGSSAVYGSDALGGVVNLVLRDDLAGGELSARHSAFDSLEETSVSSAFGQKWDRGSLSGIVSFFDRSELSIGEREVTANLDRSALGGTDTRSRTCSPGNVRSTDGANLPGLSASTAAIPPGIQGTPSVTDLAGGAGAENLCNPFLGGTLYPSSERYAGALFGRLDVLPNLEAFSEILYSSISTESVGGARVYTGVVLPQTNAFNPFGVDVLVDYQFPDPYLSRDETDMTFFRPLVGLRGASEAALEWELAAWTVEDTIDRAQINVVDDPSTRASALASQDPLAALNLFSSEPGSGALLDSLFMSRNEEYSRDNAAVSAFLRGTALPLPAGEIQYVLGAEYVEDELAAGITGRAVDASRETSSAYAEVRIPIVPHEATGDGMLFLDAAFRYDDYSDFGSSTTPQVGLRLTPTPNWSVRGNYSEAYRAPSLFTLFLPQRILGNFLTFSDPKRNGELVQPLLITGGNPNLEPEQGSSWSIGADWMPTDRPELRASLNVWEVKQKDRIGTVSVFLALANEDVLPGVVIRAPDPSGGVGPVQELRIGFTNFGELEVSGVDFSMSYRFDRVPGGSLTPSISATAVTDYGGKVTPGAPETDRLSQASLDAWAPKWKANASLTWSGSWGGATLTARYVGHYQDYNDFVPNNPISLGEDFFVDAALKLGLGRYLGADGSFWSGTYLEVGGTNLFDEEPEFSRRNLDTTGYDPSQADIRGRQLYLGVGSRW